MKVTRKIHYMWKVWEMLPKNIKKTLLGPVIGKWQFYYENKNGRIGLIKLNFNFYFNERTLWNHCWETCGQLELARFPTKKQAETAIYEALDDK